MKFGRRKNNQPDKPLGRNPISRQSTPPVYSYGAVRRSDVSSERQQSQATRSVVSSPNKRDLMVRARLSSRQLPTYISIGIIIVSVISIGIVQPVPQVVLNQDSNTVLFRPADVYQKEAEKIIKRSLLNRTKLTINTEDITRELKKQFPEIKNAVLVMPLVSRRPILQLQSEKPAVILTDTSQAYILNSEGMAVMRAADAPSSSRQNVPVINDNLDVPIKQGDTVLSRSTIQFVDDITAQLRAKGLNVQSITLPTYANEIDFKLAGQPYIIRFNVLNDARQQAGTFLAFKNSFDKSGSTPSQYIDLRVEERVYSK